MSGNSRPHVAHAHAQSVGALRGDLKRISEILDRRESIIDEQGAMLVHVHRELETQFKRIAQLQQEVDHVKKILAKVMLA